MKVLYLLNGSALYGGVKVVYQHARALRELGVDAEVLCPEPMSTWFPGLEDYFRQVESFAPEQTGAADVAVGTMWYTVPDAVRVPGAVPFHFCQSYEGAFRRVRDRWAEIEEVYRLPTYKLVISPHLAELIESRFGQTATWIPQPFEPHRFTPPEPTAARHARFRVLISGHWDLPVKGVEWGLRALRPLHEEGWLQVVRLSLDAHPEEIALWPEAERHRHLPPEQVPELMRSVDAYVGLSDEREGFGLPALEAMSCGRPCVLTDIGASRGLDPDGAAALRIPVGDGEALRSAVRRLRDAPGLAARLGAAGREIALRYDEGRTAKALLAAFEKVLHPVAARR